MNQLAGVVFACLAGMAVADEPKAQVCTLLFSNGVMLSGVPLADTTSRMARGLSGIDDPGRGMLFAWDHASPRVFWMHETRFPLTIGFISQDGTFFAINDMEHNSRAPHLSMQPANAALELTKGDFGRLGIKVGDKLLDRFCVPGELEGKE